MTTTSFNASSVHDLVKIITKATEDRSRRPVFRDATSILPATLWFRGHAQRAYQLVPSAYRNGLTPKRCLSPMIHFKSLVEHMLPRRPSSESEWLFVGQHYGIPTTLLDWTTDPLCALYFAICGMNTELESESVKHKRSAPPVIWCLDPHKLNEVALSHPPNGLLNGPRHVVAASDVALNPWIKAANGEQPGHETKPLALLPSHTTPRIIAQSGRFTIHGALGDPIESNSEMTWTPDGGHFPAVFPIAIKDPQRVLRELRSLGVSRFRYFPEVHVAADSVLMEMRTKAGQYPS